MHRRTKIVATLGPSSNQPQILEQMIKAGVNVVRLNFSHGSAEEHLARIAMVRGCAEKLGCEVGILADLQGPKIRVARFQEGGVYLTEGASFILDAELATDVGTQEHVGIDYKQLPQDVHNGDTLLLDDGRIVLRVEEVRGPQIICRVEVGGLLSNNKGINRLGGGLSADALTEKDKVDLRTAVEGNADYIAISFPRDAEDIKRAKRMIAECGGNAGVIAKIERAEAIKHIDEIIEASDGVMVARGDLAVEIGDVEVPGVQKYIIQRARYLYKPVITATQMMETMTYNSTPTRAEVSDVANAVLDQTDAVMLSAETAVGKYPVKVVEITARICLSAEKHVYTENLPNRTEREFLRIDESIAIATMFTANHMHPKAIIALTESGSTALMMSRIRSDIPIYGFSRQARTRGKMTLYQDVYPLAFAVTEITREDVNRRAVEELEKRGLVNPGDVVILTKGDSMGEMGGTNALKILTVGRVS